MAFDNDQSESLTTLGNNANRTSVDLLPKYFRTQPNKKFLNSTLDQLISEGNVEKLNVFIGRKNTPAYNSTDSYLSDVSGERSFYQLEPAVISKDNLDNITFFKDYNDYVNQLSVFAGKSIDHSVANQEESYSWNPHIDWDKFVNYREYYWLPSGPQSVEVVGEYSTNVTKNYQISLVDDGDNIAYLFNPEGPLEALIRNPRLKLYRGETYIFDIDCEDRPVAFKTARTIGSDNFYVDGLEFFDENGNSVPPGFISKGRITFTVPQRAPNILYYVSENDIDTSGFFEIYERTASTEIDVEKEIIGMKSYTTSKNVILSNGMKVFFVGNVTPIKYATGNWYVEGVGTAINLVSEKDLETPAQYTENLEIEFDNENFDTQGFDVNNNFPRDKDYIVINRSSRDRNPWSRYNRWFHREVIEASAIANGQPSILDQDSRAKRPIIEFSPNLQLFNFGKESKGNVTLVDDSTLDVFSTIEGSLGYFVDQVQLVDGMRVLFIADRDPLVYGRIFRVSSILHLNIKRITLIPDDDSEPLEGESVLVTEGKNNRGKMYHFEDGAWILSQEKTELNQNPMFDVVDQSGVSFSSSNYLGSTFKGTKLFSYKPGTFRDEELNFSITYKNVGNFGDIVFDFNLHTDTFEYEKNFKTVSKKIDTGYLVLNRGLNENKHVNGWTISTAEEKQFLINEIIVDNIRNFFKLDMYENFSSINDIELRVYINGVRKFDIDYTIAEIDSEFYLQLFRDLNEGDLLIIKSRSKLKKIYGFYEIPSNLENNPENLSLTDFTFGEINNHVRSIVDGLDFFRDTIPGKTSLRDFGNLTGLGSKIVQHSAPLLPIIYHTSDKDFNLIKSIRFAKEEYAKFKRNFLRVASTYGYDGLTRNHLDVVLKEVTKDYTKDSPFYLSDMIPSRACFLYDQEIIDDSVTDYPLIFDFDLNQLSEKAVLVYLNDTLLLHGKDYIFVNENFVRLIGSIQSGDQLKICQYESTDGCFCPPTPTKLGLYPVYEPKIFIDDTYQTPTKVIQGHDGSIVVAFDDYRDDLILEFEKRIFNNIKIRYDKDIFNIFEFIQGNFRDTSISREDLNYVLAQDFLNWSSLISDDYTKHTFFELSNSKTYNYNSFSSEGDKKLSGFWRGIFKFFYDTDRPNTCPWEMLGFSVEPDWWQDTYGPAPYTSNNLILWNDLKDGIIRAPNQIPTRDLNFVRPELLNYIPVDEEGKLKSPLDIKIPIDFNINLAKNEFIFGDHSPIETAWRKSSEYPFALIRALSILVPAKVFSSCFDRSRQFRDDTGQIVYKTDEGNLRFNIQNLKVTSTSADTVRVQTSGCVNYIVDYIIHRQSTQYVENYVNELKNLEVRLASKLGGFTTKDKFNLILESRNPLNKSNVFIPKENYQIILNTSSPLSNVVYSGVIIEKVETGFILKGYNRSFPFFRYFSVRETNNDSVINVGGISEPYVDWAQEKNYNKGRVIRHNNSFYRTKESHVSSQVFEEKYFARLPKLPIEGGREIKLRNKFESTVNTFPYGTEILTIQGVVDFLLGYGEYLKSEGFKFQNFNSEIKNITDFQIAAKEFTFWTTQNWATGSVITLSPLAESIEFQREFTVVDDVFDSFYDYGIFKQDGFPLEPSFTSNTRNKNSFSLKTKNTDDGIYHASLNLVQKEHVLVLDNITIFNDIIYDQLQGYRQDRIKIVGYRTTDWQGNFDVPGFIYDRAEVSEWKSWTDYQLGETVKYKEFYYSAIRNISGTAEFDFEGWYKLENRPESKLIPNWSYRAAQFADFYDLDTDSFDTQQQKFAQHLIGYQKREYLQNIINDDVSQYKFYQGMIQEKGTVNSLSKLFNAISNTTQDSLEFYEEWAIRLGQYGANQGFDEVEFILEESKFLINPQPIELAKSIDPNAPADFIYRILPHQVYLPSNNYNHAPFPLKAISDYFVSTSGFAREDDIEIFLENKSEILNLDIKNIKEGFYVQVAFDKSSWNIYRFTFFENRAAQFIQDGSVLRIVFPSNIDHDIVEGEYLGINDTIESLIGFHLITKTGFNFVEITAPNSLNIIELTSLSVNFYKFVPVKIKSISDINNLSIPQRKQGDLVWEDNDDNQWVVWKYENSFKTTTIEDDQAHFGINLSVDSKNTVMAVSRENAVSYYVRPSSKVNWVYKGQITPLSTQSFLGDTDAILTNNSFGHQVKVSSSSTYLLISAPKAVKTNGLSTSLNVGYVGFYKKDRNNYFTFQKLIRSSIPIANELFGDLVTLNDQHVAIISKGSLTVAPSLYLFRTDILDDISEDSDLDSNEALVDRISFNLGTTVNDLDIDENSNIIVSFSDGAVKRYGIENDQIVLIQTITYTSIPNSFNVQNDSNFGSSISLSGNGQVMAIGLFEYRQTKIGEGAVAVYKKVNNTYQFDQFILNQFKRENEKFGYNVKLSVDGSRLAVTSAGGRQERFTYFDNDITYFDQESTLFLEIESSVGSVSLFDVYKDSFVYSDNLSVGDAIGINYGLNLVVTDRVYVSDHSLTRGAIYEFYSKNKSWFKFRQPSDVVDINKIKSIFLYNTETQELITYLDLVDPLQGKILSIAEQELSFKTYYDPAIYDVGTDDVSVDKLMSWKNDNIGKLWWDLSATKFIDSNQGSILFKTTTWNKSYLDKLVDVYEWIESEYLPSEWDELADTELGLTQGISGKSKYGDSVYAVRQRYDSISGIFKNIYYFWVKNKTIVPNLEFRKISAKDVANYISNPKDMGISYVTLLDKDKFALVNCKNLIIDKKVAINFRYWIIDNFQKSNLHSHYQLVSASDTDKPINQFIEQKWFDSLSGFDKFGNPVPDPSLPAKLKYGILNRPRQSMFVNRIEALKQFIDRVNLVLKKKFIIDDFDLSKLNSKELPPTQNLGQYDTVVDRYSELRFVSVNEFRQASLIPVIDNGRLIRVIISNGGRGYLNAPNIIVDGTGSGAEARAEIDQFGKIINVSVLQTGNGYVAGTKLIVRPLTVLVSNDETSSNKWAIYSWNNFSRSWFKERVQTFDTTRFWQYIDWFAEGYNNFTRPDYIVNFLYELKFNDIKLGEIVKVNNVGQGGWVLLEKINDLEFIDTTVNYKTIGRQNGTIEFLSSIYNYAANSLGFDGINFDSSIFDDIPKEELSIILDVIKNNIFVDDLSSEYKELFFSSIRYVFSEQKSVDWAFKTSFIRSKHNLGSLQQKVNYQNDNLENYQDYLNEVKPYRSKIREFISNYEALENSNSQVSDFDLPVRYDPLTKQLQPFETRVNQQTQLIEYNSDEIFNYPYSDWFYNVGSPLIAIEIADGGSGYLAPPRVVIRDASPDLTATAFISNGVITKVTLSSTESIFLSTPIIDLVGAVGDNGREGKLVGILGPGVVRSTKVGIKFDRLSPKYTYNNIVVTQNFTGTGNRTRFELNWPIDIIKTKTTIFENNSEILSVDYDVFNEIDKSYTYTRYRGVVQFKFPPANLSSIVITYSKNIDLFDAADRIQYYYDPKAGQLGKDLGQLMTGVDYGGVEVVGINFDVGSGWDAVPWNFTGWDKFDETFTDHLVVASFVDGDPVREFYLPYIPNEIESINIYLNGVRLDDANYTEVRPLLDELNENKVDLSTKNIELVQANKDLSYWNLKFDEFNVLYTIKSDQVVDKTAERDFYPEGSDEWIIANDELQILIIEQTSLFNQVTNAENQRIATSASIAILTQDISDIEDNISILESQLSQLPALVNTSAVMNSFIGNGISNGPIVIPESVSIPQGSRFIFRKSTSDGSFTPLEYDTQLFGGDFSYNSASGIRAEDIIIDGDGFVTPDSSHAPEEVVTGQVIDTVDITVYHKVKDGSPIIENIRYVIDGDTNQFDIGQIPGSIDAVIVKIDGLIKKVDLDYNVEFESLKVTISQDLIDSSQGKILTIDSFSQNGSDLLDLDYFIGDGVTREFVTAARWSETYTVFVTVNGIPTEIESFKTDSSYDKVGNVAFRLETPPIDHAIVNYTVLGSSYDSISKVQKQLITFNGSSTYTLSRDIEFLEPLVNSVLVIKNGRVLRSSDTIYFNVSGNSRTYDVDVSKYAVNTLDSRFLTVSVNGVNINEGTGYTWISVTNQLRLKRGVANSGDRIAVSINVSADYEVTSNTIRFLNENTVGDQISVITFSNHNILDIERTSFTLRSASTLIPSSIGYARYNQSTAGRIKLESPAIGAEYIWVTVNGKILVPNVDYILENNLNYVVLNKSLHLVYDDVIEVIVFSSDTVRKPFAYKIFKDMLNKTRYSRIDDTVSTYLARNLNSFDTSILVEDATGLSEPSPENNRPGVIFVDSERIEYFRKNGNSLSQLKRGTLGTGVKNIYTIGTLVRDQSAAQLVPYKDEFDSTVDISDGQTQIIPLNFTPLLDNSTLDNSWYRDTIPTTYGQCNNIEVFVGGKRLNKAPIIIWNPELGPDSPSGNESKEADFSVNGTASVRLTEVPTEGTKIEIIRKIGKTWTPADTSLEQSQSEQARFIRLTSALVPDSVKK